MMKNKRNKIVAQSLTRGHHTLTNKRPLALRTSVMVVVLLVHNLQNACSSASLTCKSFETSQFYYYCDLRFDLKFGPE